MGGAAFSSAPYLLSTPRMPQAVYDQVKSACHARLRELYVCVASPIEGPGKSDHGDVDIIVFLERQAFLPSGPAAQPPHPRSGQEPLETIAVALGAARVIYLKPHLTSANMAVPWPGDEAVERNDDETGTDDHRRQRYVQVDVRIAQSLAEFQWWLFRHAHGDFWQLVGTTIRSLGLTADEEALWIRIPEIEARDRKRAKVLLTSDPDEVLQFLGYKGWSSARTYSKGDGEVGAGRLREIADDDTSLPNVWERGFDTVQELFDYVTTSRWFWVSPAPEADHHPSPSIPDHDPSSLRSNDRRRLKQRRVYAQWAESYLPSLRPSIRGGDDDDDDDGSSSANAAFSRLSPADRQCAVREAAFERWPMVREAYARRLETFNLETAVEAQQREILGYIRYTVAGFGQEVNWSHLAVSALKKVVVAGDETFGVLPGVPLRDEKGLYDVEEAKKFVREEGRRVGEEAWRIMCARGGEGCGGEGAEEGGGRGHEEGGCGRGAAGYWRAGGREDGEQRAGGTGELVVGVGCGINGGMVSRGVLFAFHR